MRVKCDYCDNYIDETQEQCPYCGAPNAHMTRSGTGVPKTIDELLAFCRERNIPLERMRFFIGQDYREPKAFGIYQDDEGNFVVYKNKADGSRAIRYRGDDEAYAVNEIYQKMRAEVLDRKQAAGSSGAQRSGGSSGGRSRGKGKKKKQRDIYDYLAAALVIAIILGFVYILVQAWNSPGGYYRYDDTYYYYTDDGWWIDTDDGWVTTTNVPTELEENYDDYYQGYGYSSVEGENVDEFVSVTSDDDWDWDDWDDDDWSSSDDWSWDSYSSSDTDWDSDW
jgi:hypothetical protein